jgi:hypothetical protein
MERAPEQAPRGGLGRVVLGAVAYALVAPVGLVALPLATLTFTSRSRNRGALIAGGIAAVFGLGWLISVGDLQQQTVRAAALMATATFALATVFTRWSVTHRSLVGIGAGFAGLIGSFTLFGWSWNQLHWWVEHRTAAAMRFFLGGLWQMARNSDDTIPTVWVQLLGEFEARFESTVRVMADLFPAEVALQMLIGFALAAAIHYRLATVSVGRPPGRFTGFRFTEHLGWAAIIPLAVLLLPIFAGARIIALNLVAFIGGLYLLRGLAVAAFGLKLLGGSVLLYLIVALGVFFVLPVALGGAIVLGVLDAGLDLRRRWTAPRVRE